MPTVTNIGHNSNSTVVASFTTTVTSGVPAGSTIIIGAQELTTTSLLTGSTISDSAGNTYVLAKSLFAATATSGPMAVWYCPNCLAIAANGTITYHKNASADIVIISAGYITGIGAYDSAALGFNSSTSATSLTTTSGTPSVAGELFVAYEVGSRTFTQDSNWTSPPFDNTGGNPGSIGGYRTNAGTGTLTYAPTWSLASQAVGAIIIGFKPLATAVIGAPFFDQPALKKPIIDDRLLVPRIPALQISMIADPFFEPLKLLRPIEVLTGPFAGTSPPLTIRYITREYYDVAKLKPPIEVLTGPFKWTSPRISVPYLTRDYYDTVTLKRPIFEREMAQMKPTEVTVDFNFDPFFEPIKLKAPIEVLTGPFAGTSPALTIPYVTREFFEPIRLKPSVEVLTGPFGFKSPPITVPYVTREYYDTVKLKPPIEVLIGPFGGTSPPISTTYTTREFFDTIKLKLPIVSDPILVPYEAEVPQDIAVVPFFEPVRLRPQIVENNPALFTPVAPIVSGIIFDPFFEPIRLKSPIEVLTGPFAGTSPAITTPYITREYYDAARLRPLVVENNPVLFTPTVTVTISFTPVPFFDTVKLKAPIEAPTGPFQPITIIYSLSNWFEPVRLRQITVDNAPALFRIPALVTVTFDPFFEPTRLRRAQDDRQFAAISAPIQAVVGAAWFEPIRATRIAVGLTDFNFTFAPPPVTPTIQNALTDWYAAVRLRQPIIDQPVVVFYPAQVTPTTHLIQRTLTGVGL